MKKETKILQKIIEKFVTKNLKMVQEAQAMAKIILDHGLIETSKNMPFQIIPTDLSDSDGDVICKLFVNLENPLYGFFQIELQQNRCIISCPKTYHTQVFVSTYDDCYYWLQTVIDETDSFYQLSEMANSNNIDFCNLELNSLLQKYKELITPEIEKIKKFIGEDEKIAIVSERVYAMAKEAQKDFSRALIIPQLWVVFKDLDNLPEQGEDVDEYLDAEKTNLLYNKLEDFAAQERYYAAPLYLAQRVCLQAGLKVEGFAASEENWVEAVRSAENGEFILPAIEITEFRVS